MPVLWMGLRADGQPLIPRMPDEDEFAEELLAWFDSDAARIQRLAKLMGPGAAMRGEVQRPTVDQGNPLSVGWTFVVHADDPARADIVRILRPLAERRGMPDVSKPLLYSGDPLDSWLPWFENVYRAQELNGRGAQKYVLLVGGPDRIPFMFQSLLGTVARVGRLDFPSLDELETYVGKLLRLETASDPVVQREVVLFAPDEGLDADGNPLPTNLSRNFMAEPMARMVRHDLKFGSVPVFGDAATKSALIDTLRKRRPAVVYTASHGLADPSMATKSQRELHGAIWCQDGKLFSAADVPMDDAFLEGALVFQFACHSYGTPAWSDIAHWLPDSSGAVGALQYTDQDFVAALPKRLLAHPRGPVAFIGHLDSATVIGTFDVKAQVAPPEWNQRLAPFVSAVRNVLATQPSGLAMDLMRESYSVCAASIAARQDLLHRGDLERTKKLARQMMSDFILRNDSQNYMILGDPAARVRIPTA